MKNSFLITNEKEKCCGCKACVDACPFGAITMKSQEHFLYPEVDNTLCKKCGRCEDVCPYNHDIHNSLFDPQEYHVLKTTDAPLLKDSSSGGAFTVLSNAMFSLYEKVVVFGVEWADNFKVQYSYADSAIELNRFRKSKYIQADTNSCFSKVSWFLNEGFRVLFFGNPCVCFALKSYLHFKEYDNLLLVDIFCHGVPSEELFAKYIKETEYKYGKIQSYSFKNKRKYYGVIDSTTAQLTTIKNKHYLLTKYNDPFVRAYYHRLSYRPSCYKCPWAETQRVGDLSIGDAWGIEQIHKEYDPNTGVSAILVNTDKGKELLFSVKNAEIQPVDKDLIVLHNDALQHPTILKPSRDKFFASLDEGKSFYQSVFSSEKQTIGSRIFTKCFNPLLWAIAKKSLKK